MGALSYHEAIELSPTDYGCILASIGDYLEILAIEIGATELDVV